MKQSDREGLATDIVRKLEDSIRPELPRIVLEELGKLPLNKFVSSEVIDRITTLEQLVSFQLGISGGDSQGAKRAESTTTPTQVTGTTGTSSLVLALGEVLEDLDTLITIAMKLRSNLQLPFKNVQVGDSGLTVPRNSDSDKVQYIHVHHYPGDSIE